jgi:hypothetical protein
MSKADDNWPSSATSFPDLLQETYDLSPEDAQAIAEDPELRGIAADFLVASSSSTDSLQRAQQAIDEFGELLGKPRVVRGQGPPYPGGSVRRWMGISS